MINGSVTASREAVISLKVRGPNGQELDLDAVLDTGFTGFMTLPANVIVALGLPWITQGRVLLGNGQEEACEIYAVTVVWDGQPWRVMAEEADTTPLVGMSLMYGYEIVIQDVDGGTVSLRKM